jgi:hypothetical protein
MTYREARRLLETAKDRRDGKPIANNTRIFDRGDHLAIRLHDTDIIELFSNGTYRLNSRGWRTYITKERINRFAPVRLWQDHFEWYLTVPPSSEILEFEDGMTIQPDGSIITEENSNEHD